MEKVWFSGARAGSVRTTVSAPAGYGSEPRTGSPQWGNRPACVALATASARVAQSSALEQLLRPASEFFEVREQPAGFIARSLPAAVLHFVLETQDASVTTLLAIG